MSQQPERNREDSFREARKQIVRSAFLALAALGVIVFACYAWFVSSGTVTGKISSVLLNGSTFELASVGDTGGAWDNLIPDYDQFTPEEWTHDNDETQYWATTNNKNTVLWRLSDNSNLGNNTNAGIHPGTNGDISFYVIPKTAGDLTLKFHIELIPFKLSSDSTQNESTQVKAVPVDGDVLKQLEPLLKGHFLFYWTENGTKSWVPCNTGEFTMTFTGCKVDKAIRVKLSWKWPLLLQHVSNETGIGDHISDKQNRNYFFYADPENGESIPVEIDLKNNYYQLSKLFNNADQYIGRNMDCLEVRLSAQMN